MQIDVTRSILIIVICAGCTVLERSLPFLVFRGKEVPRIIQYLGRVLPMAIMATLVIYCIKGITFTSVVGWAPYLIGIAITAALHWWGKNALFSIAGGTIAYMLMVQMIFV
ncbi:MAG: AzlD domain-containing protein [Clostridiales bacterium]|nr:AzlD domain-containing protein [Candidatus Cacconaster stercorequi]